MIHEDGADRRAEKLGCAKSGVGVEKYICAAVEDQRSIFSSDRPCFYRWDSGVTSVVITNSRADATRVPPPKTPSAPWSHIRRMGSN